ncbi:MAG: efflux RND transporter periplasmic adaptor subunit [Marinobacter sp.]|nr:efflux RND transporter periplasmic adaptor subunit [Marinobacter sp.]
MNNLKKTLLPVLALILVVVLVWALRPGPLWVSAAAVTEGPFVETVQEEGRTRLRNSYNVSVPINGFLRRVELEPGEVVAAGDTLFVIEPAPAPALDARSREQARETLAAAGARLRAAEALLEQARSEVELADTEYQRHQQLFARGSVSQASVDRLRAELNRARAQQGSAIAGAEAARYEVENARAVLAVTEGTRSEGELLSVKAPVSGTILRRHRCCEGVIAAGTPVLEIGDLAELEVQVDLLSMDAVRVTPGMRVVLERWGGEGELTGQVRRVEPAGFTRVSALGVDEQRVPVLVEITTPRDAWGSLGDGYRVEAKFVLWEHDAVVQVPVSALFRQGNQWWVYLIDQDRARLRQVTPGRRSGLTVQILDGLAPGEIVITHPGDQIAEGVRVQVD